MRVDDSERVTVRTIAGWVRLNKSEQGQMREEGTIGKQLRAVKQDTNGVQTRYDDGG